MKFFYSDTFLKHSLGAGHPESPERLIAIKEAIKRIGEFIEPKDIKEEELYIVHEKEYIEKLKELSKQGAIFPDNVFSKETFNISKLAASAAKEAALNCEKEFSFALVRPPGHHAGSDYFSGFCYINNIAFAVRSLQHKEKNKVLICDFDVHAGDGSANIFYEDNSVFYLSFHQDPATIYPGTGFESESTEHVRYVCFSQGTKDEPYLKRFETVFSECYNIFKPDFIAISAGFDTYYKDPLGGLSIMNSKTYNRIGKVIASHKKPTFASLEGGYSLGSLGKNVYNFVTAFE